EHRLLPVDREGKPRTRNGPELARWKTKLLGDFGFVEIPATSLPSLPADAPAAAVETWAVLARFLGERWLTEPETEPFAFSAPWIAKRYVAPEPTVKPGKRWLEENGFLLRA